MKADAGGVVIGRLGAVAFHKFDEPIHFDIRVYGILC